MDTNDRRVQVEIHGRTYTLRGEREPEAVKELAAYVNDKMSEITSRSTTADTTRIAILTALNLADELFQAQEGEAQPAAPRGLAARDRALCRMLDEVLAG